MTRKIQILMTFNLIPFFCNLLHAQWWKSYPNHQEGTLIYITLMDPVYKINVIITPLLQDQVVPFS